MTSHYPRLSVVMAAHQKAEVLPIVLHSIVRQVDQPGEVEIIVSDDGSTDHTAAVCHDFRARYIRIDRPPGYGNPSRALNAAFLAAKAPIVVIQSADVVHMGSTLPALADLAPQTFNIGTVFNVRAHDGCRLGQYTGPETPDARRPLFFLGSIRLDDIMAAGGMDEDFDEPGFDDDWLGLCLTQGLGMTAVYRGDIIGHHVDHPRPDLSGPYARMREKFSRKIAAGWFRGSILDQSRR